MSHSTNCGFTVSVSSVLGWSTGQRTHALLFSSVQTSLDRMHQAHSLCKIASIHVTLLSRSQAPDFRISHTLRRRGVRPLSLVQSEAGQHDRLLWPAVSSPVPMMT